MTKPLTYYVDCPAAKHLSQHFGAHLEQLPEHHLWDMTMAIAGFMNNQTNPMCKSGSSWDCGGIHNVFGWLEIDFDNAEYSEYIQAEMGCMTFDELKGLNCFLANRLNQ